MSISIRPARAASDLAAIHSLLASCQLPELPADTALENFFVVAVSGKIVACAGMEIYGSTGLARSLAVEQGERKRGFASNLLDKLVEQARTLGLKEIYGLTTTAQNYMLAHGFEITDRSDVPADLLASAQFESQCPASAVVLKMSL